MHQNTCIENGVTRKIRLADAKCFFPSSSFSLSMVILTNRNSSILEVNFKMISHIHEPTNP